MGPECSPSSEHPHPHRPSLAPVLTEGQHSDLRAVDDDSHCDHHGSDGSHVGVVTAVMVVMAKMVVMIVMVAVIIMVVISQDDSNGGDDSYGVDDSHCEQ